MLRPWLPEGIILAAAIGFKAALLGAGVFPFNADEAVVGLMARHILAGSWPVFFYGQAYMGSLDATLVALAYTLFGSSVWPIRAVQVLLYAGTTATVMAIAQRVFRRRGAALAAGALMAFPPVNVMLYTTVSLGGYGEALLLGSLVLLQTLRLEAGGRSGWGYLLWGLLAGSAFWAFGLSLVFTIPAGWLLLRHIYRMPDRERRRRLAVVAAGLAAGALPWLYWAAMHGPRQLIEELLGSAIAAEGEGLLLGSLERLRNLALFGPTVIWGMRPPWSTRLLALPLMPFALFFWLIALFRFMRRFEQAPEARIARPLLGGVFVVLFLGFVLSPFGNDPSGRYFVPLIVPFALLGAGAVSATWSGSAPRVVRALFGLALAFQIWGTVEAASTFPPGLTTQFDAVTRIDHRADGALMAFLGENGERRGYTNYWVAYPLAFLSNETLIYVPRLPYHLDFRYTARDDRYPPYDDFVAASDRVAYITTHHDALDRRLREAFQAAGINWREAQIGDYHVFYELSRPLRAEELNLLP